MPPKKKIRPEVEAVTKGPDVPSLADQARSEREGDAQSGRDNMAKLRSQRLAREAASTEKHGTAVHGEAAGVKASRKKQVTNMPGGFKRR